jgi:hypothetical protein
MKDGVLETKPDRYKEAIKARNIATDISPKHSLGQTRSSKRSIRNRGLTEGLRDIAGCLEKVINLLAGDQDFAHSFAGAKEAASDEPPD